MKIQSLNDKLFSIGGITYAKGDFIPDYLNTTYVSGAVDQTQCEPVVNLINKATGLPMFKAYVNWRQFKNSSDVAYADFNTLQLELATNISGNFASVGPTGPVGPQGATGPSGLVWKGAWVSGTSYVADDAVGYGGASYFCILATSGTTTPDLDTTNWALLASQGAVGPTGPTGATGPAGAAGATGATGATGPGATQTLQETVDLGNTITDGIATAELYPNILKFTDLSTDKFALLGAEGILIAPNNLYSTFLGTENLTATRNITLPDASGILALTNQLPQVANDFVNDAAATIGGIVVGGLYHTAGVVKIRLT